MVGIKGGWKLFSPSILSKEVGKDGGKATGLLVCNVFSPAAGDAELNFPAELSATEAALIEVGIPSGTSSVVDIFVHLLV